MQTWHASGYHVSFHEPFAPDYSSHIPQRLVRHAIRTVFCDELFDVVHLAPSSSATILSIAVRSWVWRATIWVISALSSVMLVSSRVSSGSTWAETARL